MKPDSTTIPCPNCSGTGKVKLRKCYQPTWDIFAEKPDLSCPEALAIMRERGLLPKNCDNATVHMRVARMVRMGALKPSKLVRKKQVNGEKFPKQKLKAYRVV